MCTIEHMYDIIIFSRALITHTHTHTHTQTHILMHNASDQKLHAIVVLVCGLEMIKGEGQNRTPGCFVHVLAAEIM